MKYLKLSLIFAAILFLPATIFATNKDKLPSCDQGFKRNTLGICEEIKAPSNSRLNSLKDDFECDRGYIKNKENWSCDPIKLPENGVLTIAGHDWTCIATYKREGNKCEKVTLPENAKFYIQGSDFYCNFGYQKEADKCIKLELPNNARWSYDGNDWECNKGYKESDDKKSCVEVKIPDNAQPNFIGTFNCNSGYKKVGDKCEKQPDVENAKYYSTGSDFYCNEGYKKNESERKCEKIKIPENAHSDNLSLEGWSCNSTYNKDGDQCKPFTLPEHAFWFNNSWGCELGYRKNPSNQTCDKITLPENAHYINTYDGWECNSGYSKNYRENRCDKI